MGLTFYDEERGTTLVKNFEKAVDRLAEYENAEEQGLLLKLPCKLGDSVWDTDLGRPEQFIVTGFSYGDLNDYGDYIEVFDKLLIHYRNSSGSITGDFVITEIGKSVFLTREEAKQKISEISWNLIKKERNDYGLFLLWKTL